MTNREKYEKQILDVACGGSCVGVHIKTMTPISCDLLDCDECYFSTQDDGDCSIACQEWCNSEYVESPVDWSKVPVDTPILVRDSQDNKWFRRHFANFKDGVVYAWDDGKTSWSSLSLGKVGWVYAKLAEDEV
ncbi:hypothetical protein [Eubacterium ramulus]|uniref:hypothetical protein n=1 Tax=Eubacterium ramulus TaxID=39490 RepID=UPI00399A8F1E